MWLVGLLTHNSQASGLFNLYGALWLWACSCSHIYLVDVSSQFGVPASQTNTDLSPKENRSIAFIGKKNRLFFENYLWKFIYTYIGVHKLTQTHTWYHFQELNQVILRITREYSWCWSSFYNFVWVTNWLN